MRDGRVAITPTGDIVLTPDFTRPTDQCDRTNVTARVCLSEKYGSVPSGTENLARIQESLESTVIKSRVMYARPPTQGLETATEYFRDVGVLDLGEWDARAEQRKKTTGMDRIPVE